MSDEAAGSSEDRQKSDDQRQVDAEQKRMGSPDEASGEPGPLPEDTDAPDPERAFRHEMPDGSPHD